MWNRVRNLWRPENFHYAHLLGGGPGGVPGGGPGVVGGGQGGVLGRALGRDDGQFEGWYLKLVDADGLQPYALIPGVFLGRDRHAFIQVLDGRSGTAAYHRFPIESFESASDRFDISIAGNRFSAKGISLSIDAEESSAKQSVHGDIRFGPWRPWPVTTFSPGIMGPFSFVPFMQCNHGILSLDHSLDGTLTTDTCETNFSGGRGYVEKDWGRAFPEGYVWVHSNHFSREGVSLTAAVATIPWLTGDFRGYIIGLLVDGTLHRFTTYTGSELESLTMSETHLHLRIRNRSHRLEVDASKSDGAILHAPYEKQMIERVAETMTSGVDVRLVRLEDESVAFEGHGVHACLEAQGNLDAILSG